MKIFRTLFIVLVSALLTFAFTYATTDIPAIGDPAPEISMPNPQGEIITLSNLKGKVVLVNFWASWCRNCRLENNNLTATYKQYKNQRFDIGQGFEVFSVSLDTDKNLWKEAIANDDLSWENHVSDFLKWKSPVVKDYNFQFLPHNLILDQNGKILAKGLYGNKLNDFLASHLSQ